MINMKLEAFEKVAAGQLLVGFVAPAINFFELLFQALHGSPVHLEGKASLSN